LSNYSNPLFFIHFLASTRGEASDRGKKHSHLYEKGKAGIGKREEKNTVSFSRKRVDLLAGVFLYGGGTKVKKKEEWASARAGEPSMEDYVQPREEKRGDLRERRKERTVIPGRGIEGVWDIITAKRRVKSARLGKEIRGGGGKGAPDVQQEREGRPLAGDVGRGASATRRGPQKEEFVRGRKVTSSRIERRK